MMPKHKRHKPTQTRRTKPFYDGWTTSQRIEAAKAKMNGLIGHLQYLLAIQANNTLIVYSSVLSSQIPRSYAANAFNVFQRSAHQFEVMRLCALWDDVGKHRESIPTVVALVDDEEVIEALAAEMQAHWDNIGAGRHSDLDKNDQEAAAAIDRRYGTERAAKVRTDLKAAIKKSKAVQKSPKLKSLMNARHKHLAHNLSATKHELRGLPLRPLRYGDPAHFSRRSIPIAEALYCGVNGASFSFEDSRRFYRKAAKSLWRGCKVNVRD